MGKRGPQPGPEKLLCTIRLTPKARAFLERKAVEADKGDRGGMSYLARNVEAQAAADERKSSKKLPKS